MGYEKKEVRLLNNANGRAIFHFSLLISHLFFVPLQSISKNRLRRWASPQHLQSISKNRLRRWASPQQKTSFLHSARTIIALAFEKKGRLAQLV